MKCFQKVTLVLLLLSVAYPVSAQLVLRKNPLPETPQASEQTRYGTHNVNLYTGRVSINIPVGTYKDSDFEIPVSLNYSFNGFRPNEQASEAGLGWTVSCGGIITRETRGLPDEERGSMKIFPFSCDWSQTVYPYDQISTKSYSGCTDDVYVQVLTDQFSKDGAVNALFQIEGDYFDAQPDVYHFNFLGHSGSFVRRPDGTFLVYDTGGDILYKVEKASVEDSGGYNSYYSEICITTGDGYKYIFGGSRIRARSRIPMALPMMRQDGLPQEPDTPALQQRVLLHLLRGASHTTRPEEYLPSRGMDRTPRLRRITLL